MIGIEPPADVQTQAPEGLKIVPKSAGSRFAMITNSSILASGVASQRSGIRIIVDGAGEAGSLDIALVRRAGSFHEEVTQGQISYTKTLSYNAGPTTIDIPWAEFKGPGNAPTLPYPFNGLRIIGQRTAVTPLTIQSIALY